jgi:hypothetical protein
MQPQDEVECSKHWLHEIDGGTTNDELPMMLDYVKQDIK